MHAREDGQAAGLMLPAAPIAHSRFPPGEKRASAHPGEEGNMDKHGKTYGNETIPSREGSLKPQWGTCHRDTMACAKIVVQPEFLVLLQLLH